MHLLAAIPGAIDDGGAAVDLGQSPGELIVLSAADTELALLADARGRIAGVRPRLRLANLLTLGHPMSVDLYLERTVRGARLVVVRLLGGAGYWRYGLEQLVELARSEAIALAVLPGDDQPDPSLAGRSTLGAEACHRLWQYLVHGGPANAQNFLRYAGALIGLAPDRDWLEPAPLVRAGVYWPGGPAGDLAAVRMRWAPGQPVCALVFYRALVQAGDLDPIDALVAALGARGLAVLPVFVTSLKDPDAAAVVAALFAETAPDLVINATAFAAGSADGTRPPGGPFAAVDAPVLQVVLAGGTEAAWQDGTHGLSAREIAMAVALPEIDGRIFTRAVSFKAEARVDAATELAVIRHRHRPDRVAFVADLAANWMRLRRTPPAARRVALVLANYPNRDGRIGNGVGLDTPASVATLLALMAVAGYAVEGRPADGAALMARLGAGPTNDLTRRDRAAAGGERLGLDAYRAAFAGLPAAVRDAVTARWGDPADDPFVVGDAFVLPLHRLGAVVVGIQPARGYNIDPVATYHAPDLVPPHGYFAFYLWLRVVADVHGLVQVGKHGNQEWLPGKALALSESCFPEVVLGPTPHLYPFIVNDPGEGSQAKRRAGAVILDHLTPPLTRAESYGPLRTLELLVDEYFEAALLDPRRTEVLRDQIIDRTRALGLDRDCGIAADDDDASALAKLDNHLCTLKELQIRDGLHVYGHAPTGGRRADLLVALVRLPRPGGGAGGASILRALAADLGLGDRFDPLDETPPATPWAGPRPAVLAGLVADRWRTVGDTVERLETLARDLVGGARACPADWTRTAAVLETVCARIGPAVDACGVAERAALLAGLDGRFVAPGPSGAPTRGRPEVLPTGRNFFSVDTRTVPTPAAWQLGWASAARLLARHRRDHGMWPRALAVSAWGTANMRTGGDDVAQVLALIGVQPTWDAASRRVTGFEVLPLGVLDRPRIDVTLRVSGFFRDAFPAQIDLVDSAVRAVAALDEPERDNPLAARVRADAAAAVARGAAPAEARRRAGFRVFGSMPGAYGAGLQALIDERGWRDDADLARAYVAWGGFAYGGDAGGEPVHGLFARRLAAVEAVVHNQDNREHDLLDSDDYYQFEGGLAAAVRHHAGAAPAVYHMDHSRPETPQARTLAEEIGRVVRARVVNPKWLAGVMRHGYKGAAEIAATVDYLFAFAATARAVGDHHFDAVYEAVIADPAVSGFIAAHNPAARREIAARLGEAIDRGLWRPRRNSAYHDLDRLAEAEGEDCR